MLAWVVMNHDKWSSTPIIIVLYSTTSHRINWNSMITQHPFVTNVQGKEGIEDLVSELRADVTCEEKDIDEVWDVCCDVE